METQRFKNRQIWQVLAITLVGLVFCAWLMVIPSAWAEGTYATDRPFGGERICTATAEAALKACHHEARDDLWIAVGSCANLADADARYECLAEAGAVFKEDSALCREQIDARLEICDAIGEAAYDPQLVSEEFVDFEAVLKGDASFTANPYFPLTPGVTRIYVAKDEQGNKFERIKVEVLAETKEILGINCLVVRDRVWELDEEGERELIEDTLDWYAQDLAGNVWYMGEIARNFEEGELVDLEGSWKAGRDLAKPGILMPAAPENGRWYRQEFLLGEAEDVAEVAGYVETLTVRGRTYENLLQTRDFTPIEPDQLEYKYYAPGVGLVLEENPEAGERVELIRLK